MYIKVIVTKIILAIGAFIYLVGFLWFVAYENFLNTIIFLTVLASHVIVIFNSGMNTYCKISCVILIANYFYLFMNSFFENTNNTIWFDAFFPLLELLSVIFIWYFGMRDSHKPWAKPEA